MIPATKPLFGPMLIAIGTAILSLACTQASAQEYTQAERLLFLNNHFVETDLQTITYHYRHYTTGATHYTDEVFVDVLERHRDGTASVATRFLSGDRSIAIPTLENAEGNPAILGFLERDIADMKRLTGGSTDYFRKAIRTALAMPGTKVVEKTISYEGRSIKGQEIVINPYTGDPHKAQLGSYVNKSYVFILSDAVPGTLYSAYTRVGSTGPSLETSLTILSGVLPE
ncbi:hypothetical protein EKL30_11960 [Candidimonas sp. SYP-B2681]|uniref:hypothetical protein n=1 Tax=Candidimonas sp. SYP-B2681 TaxID=2497686 RepID=UPI000F885368|nr:hypothetical protein [Candidimonas sp. SYP-B2681]RTZ42418.1 hypothetical protein EKL30_11960 [Candidimonas sp. SYP-B2681]